MHIPSMSLLSAVYAAYLLDCITGVLLLWKYFEGSRHVQDGKSQQAMTSVNLPVSLIFSRAITMTVLTVCLVQIVALTPVQTWACIGFAAFSLALSVFALVKKILAPRSAHKPALDSGKTSLSYTFPINPKFEALWSANPQYYEAGTVRLRKVELPHWRFESPEFTDVIFVLEGIIMVETAIGSPNGAATRHAVDLVWQIAEEMNIRHTRAVLFSDAYNVRKSSFEARKIAAQFYGEAARIWDCYLFLNPAVRVSFQLSKPFAPSAFRSIRIADSFHDGIRSILSHYSRAVVPENNTMPENNAGQPREYSFPTNPYFEERWKYSLEYLEHEGVKLRKVQPAEWHYQGIGGEQAVFMLEGAMLVVKIQSQRLDNAAIQAMMAHVEEILLRNGNETIPMALTLDFSEVPIDSSLLCADAEPMLRDTMLLSICCLTSPLIREKVQTSRIVFPARLPDGSAEEKVVWFGGVQDEALDAMLVHFIASDDNEIVEASEETKQVGSRRADFHEHRIEQIYTLLARIADSEPETLEPPRLPSDDLYADVFKAMEVVYEDKRRQMQEIMEQKYLLEKQASQIQEVNTQLSFHNTQLDEQNQQLAALNTEKNELMSIVAHDLKNPIGAVRSMAELIAAGHTLKPQVVAENIINTANRMLGLVGNLLDLNRLESGAKIYHCVEIDIAPFIDTTIWQYRHAAEKKNITFHYSAEAPHTLAIADEQAILQIVDNLISNAVKYSPQGKNVFVRIRNDELTTAKVDSRAQSSSRKGTIRIEVQDEGEGISREDMKRLFGKFARLSAQPTGGEHSTGLGLSIVKKMVEAMEGRVWCESEPGKGAMFVVELPSPFHFHE